MQTSLTDQLYQNEQVGTADQGSLTDQLFPEEQVPVVAPTPVVEEKKAFDLRTAGNLIGPKLYGINPQEAADESLRKATGDALLSKAKQIGMSTVGAGELAMNMASGMLLYMPAKIKGVMALPWGREVANIAEEEILKLGYQPYTEEGKQASELVGKGFELLLKGASNADEYISSLAPRAGYLVEFGLELATFAITGGLVKGAKNIFKPGYKQASKLIDAKNKYEKADIDEQMKDIDGIPNEVLKNALKKEAEMKKVQSDLERAEAEKKLDTNYVLQDLRDTGIKVKGIKQAKKNILDEQVNKAMEKIKEPKVEKPKTTTKTVPKSETPLTDQLVGEETPRQYQERLPEKTVHEDWDKANSPRYIFEGAGDILREYQKSEADAGYITEKLNRVKKFISGELNKSNHPDDSYVAAKLYENERLNRLTKQYEDQPVISKQQQLAKDAIISLLKGDFRKANELYSKIEKSLGETENVKSFNELTPEELSDLGLEYRGVQEGIPGKIPDKHYYELKIGEGRSTQILVDSKDRNEVLKKVNEKLDEYEKAEDLDYSTGTREPIELETDSSPFREDPAVTKKQAQLYNERMKEVAGDPELFIGKLVNDVNRFLDGDKVDIEKVRNGLSEMAARAEEVRDYFRESEDYPSNFENWKEMVSDAASWARRANKTEVPSTQLNMMIPLDKIPKIVADFYNDLKKVGKSIRYGDMFRNRDMFDITGYWLGRDGKWRYEIDDSKAKYNVPQAVRTMNAGGKPLTRNITEVLDYPELYEAIPEIKNVTVIYDPNLKVLGQQGRTTIVVRNWGDKSTVLHELQHAVNEKMGVPSGSSVSGEKSNIIRRVLNKVLGADLDVTTKNTITDILYDIEGNRDRVGLSLLEDNYDKYGLSKDDIGTLKSLTSKGFEEYKKNPGEMESRVVERRMDMTEIERKAEAPWETLDEMLGIEALEALKGPEYYEAGTKLYDIGGATIDTLIKTSKSFKEWFGNSKINEVVFHGSPNRFTAFDPTKKYGGIGFHFGNKSQAINRMKETVKQAYDFGEGEKASLNSGYLRIENPLYMDDSLGWDVEAFTESVHSQKLSLSKDTISKIDKLNEDYHNDKIHVYEATKQLEQILKDAGYDGIVYDNAVEGPGKSYAIFDANQFKSIKNVGSFSKTSDQFLYDIGGATAEGARQIIAGAKKVAEYTKRARGMKSFKPMEAAKMLKDELARSFVDRSGNIRRDLLDKLGDKGYEIIQKMYLSKGASSISANMLKQMQKEVYNGLSNKEKTILDTLILSDRMVDIGQYKTNFKFPEDIKPTNSVAYRELFEQIEKLTPEQAENIRTRAAAYYEWMKKPLKDMLDAGLISEKEYNDLVTHNYRRLKLVDVYDKRYTSKIGKKTRTVYDSGVEALSHGRETDIFEPSSEIMALEVFNRAYGRIMNNLANTELLKLAESTPENPFVRVKTKEQRIPSGWNRIFVYDKGERKALYLSPEMSKEWITNNPEMSYRMSQLLRYTSGSQVLRTFATGINWGFALANLPRDIMHTWFAARYFENGQWNGVYSPILPVFGRQIGRDLASVFIDAATRGKRYNDYINEGGGMEFMVHQGRILQRGRHLESNLDKIENFLGYFGETSEIMTRLAIRERMLRKGKTPQEATFAARDYMDFGQGGGIAKAADNALPYLNAAIQGTRGLLRSFKDSPFESSFKLAQFAAVTVGLYIAMKKMNPESMKNLEGNVDTQNNLVIPLGDQFGFVDEEGQTRYPYIKIPLDPGQKFFKTFFEASTDKWMGNEVDVNRVVDSLKQLSPASVGDLPPTISGTLGYMANKDFWLNEDIWKQTEKPFSYPQSAQEYTGDTPQGYVDFGKVTGMSPERTKYMVEELITGNSEWAWLANKGYEGVFGDLSKEKKEQHLALTLAKTPGINRFIGVTSPYSKYATKIDKAQEDVVLKQFVENRDFDTMVEGYLYDKSVKRDEVISKARSYKDKDTYDRLMERMKFEEAIKTLPEKSFWRRMKGLRTEAKAKMFVERLNSATAEEKSQLWNEYSIVSKAGGIVSKDFREEVRKLRNE